MGEEHSHYGRAGKLYMTGTGPGKKDWVANCTEINVTVDEEGNAEGTLTVDMVNSTFERKFIDYVNGPPDAPPHRYFLWFVPETFPNPNIAPDELWFNDVKFWSLPVGYQEVISRDIDFTAKEDEGNQHEYTFRFNTSPTGSDSSVPSL